MTTGQTPNLDTEKAPVVQRIDPYENWRMKEGVLQVGGVYIPDLNEVEVGPWPRKGVNGALCYLDGDDESDEHIVELPPGEATVPEHHMYSEAIYVLSGRGSTSVWYEGEGEHTFEWGPGSYFVLPTNVWHRLFNASMSRPARYFSVTNLPGLLRQWVSEDFIFNNPYEFRDRYAGQPDYFSAEAKLYRGRVWETNFVPDMHKLQLYEWKSRGGGGAQAALMMGGGIIGSHLSRFLPGYYKKGHRHGPDAHLLIIEGEGFVLTQRGDEPRIRCDWQRGSLYLSGAGQGQWLHQHFNVGSTPAAYLRMSVKLSRRYTETRWDANKSTVILGGEVSQAEGGAQVEYANEDPDIHRMFEDELKKRGLTCKMKAMSPYCTGEVGAADYHAHFEEPDEHK